MPFAMTLACFGMGLTFEEALVAATINGAYSLDRAATRRQPRARQADGRRARRRRRDRSDPRRRRPRLPGVDQATGAVVVPARNVMKLLRLDDAIASVTDLLAAFRVAGPDAGRRLRVGARGRGRGVAAGDGRGAAEVARGDRRGRASGCSRRRALRRARARARGARRSRQRGVRTGRWPRTSSPRRPTRRRRRARAAIQAAMRGRSPRRST